MKQVIVTTSWDDGHKLDLRLAELLKKYSIRGTFYIAPNNREWKKKNLLSNGEIKRLSKDFEIGAHTLTHPLLFIDFKTRCERLVRSLLKRSWKPGFEIAPKISLDEAEKEILGSKKYLERLLGKEMASFCYPDGRYSLKIQKIVEKIGFKYARTVERYQFALSKNIFACGTTIHAYRHYQDVFKIARFSQWSPIEFIKSMDWGNLARSMFNRVVKHGGVYHLWGHSWEINENNDWEKLEKVFSYISHRKNVKYLTNGEMARILSLPKKNVKPKLLVATPYFSPHIGGVEKHIYTILKGLKKKYDYKIVVITSNHEGKTCEEEDLEGMKIYRLPWQFKISNTPISFFWGKKIREIIEKEEPDVINGRGPVPFISDIACSIAKQMNIPFVLGWHFPTMKKGNLIYDPIIFVYESIFLKRMLNNSAKIICSSQYIEDALLKNYQDITTVITQGINESLFKVISIKKEKNSILFVGNLETDVKGLDYLLDAIKILVVGFPTIKLNVIGLGNINKYQQKCIDLNINQNVSFKGLLLGEKLVEEYNRNEIFVCPSTSENYPSTMLEAMNCGLPIIASNVGNIPNFINNNINGLLVYPRDGVEIASKIRWLLNNPLEAKKIANNGLVSVKGKFNWEDRIRKTHEVMLQALKK